MIQTPNYPCIFDPEKIKDQPKDVEPEMNSVLTFFNNVIDERKIRTNPRIRLVVWTQLVNSVAPGKLQIEFTADDWQKVIAHIRN